MNRQPDLIAAVRFYSEEEGGRRGATPPVVFRCPFEFNGEKFDCGLHLEKSGALAPGVKATVPITLLFPEKIKPRLKVGNRFTLWEMRVIAEGIIEQILPN